MEYGQQDSIIPDTSDPKRLAELDAFDILDTAPEEAFDDVVQIARTICHAPVALVSLVAGDRQWFKARAGFDARETDLNSSVCAHALAEPGLLIIPDLTQDPRTARNPLVTGEPYIRFYAGAPLRTETGRALGSLCVIDNQPRPAGLTEVQADLLRRLSRQVMILMRERQQLARMQAAELQARFSAARRLALIELGDHLRDASTIAEMTARAGETVGRILGANRAGYGELDETGQVIALIQEWTAPGTRSALGSHPPADYADIAPCIERGENVIVEDVREDPRTASRADDYAALDIVSMLNAPVRERGRTVGVLYVHASKRRRWAPEEEIFARNVVDRLQIGMARLRAEEEQAVLNHELSHRMKNTLAMVQAITTQTFRNAPDLKSAHEALTARLIAMGKAHDLLLTGIRESASLEAVLKGALAIHDDAQAGRLRLSGPFVQVGSGAALSLALMIHELATNAAKYGALSRPDGYVAVDWKVFEQAGEPHLRLCWVEHDGPPVQAPERRGFGTRLIERGLLSVIGAEVELTFPATGVVCAIVVPLVGLAADRS